VKLTRLSFSIQSTVLIELPDIPGEVVQVNDVLWMVSSFTMDTAITVILHHNTALSVSLSVNDFGSAWCRMDQASGGGPPQVGYHFADPYELVGRQRCDFVASAGSVIGTLAILYSVRAEPNRTLWNGLRRTTSFERG